MKRAFALCLAALALLLPHAAATAQSHAPGGRVVSVTRWVEEWDPASRQWVRVADAPAGLALAGFESAAARPAATHRNGSAVVAETVFEEPIRFIAAPRGAMAGARAPIARFGPFAVLDSGRAAVVDATDASSPQAFAAMMAAYPNLAVLEFLDAPGTSHDLANLKLGRAIRRAGLATHVPAGGSARSGAVELFLAGTRRTVEPGAMFAVHSWRDGLGREPADFAPDAPENRLYLDYYAEMGMSPQQARAFYAMTNSVPHAGAKWLDGAEMARWIAPAERENRAPADRLLEPRLEQALRVALARSGEALAGAFRPSVRLPAALPAPEPAPRLAYALGTTGLLDSGAAFP
ncbi:hypothetical protein [Erythrobacter sp. WG]|uniref:hypothetical protein n=1 Tax=Erythrobacter sp. WG TaxID=2985510 RepID=UPI002B4BEE3C|nr:hypothetical protein [Erythrobacter sp. WG]